MTDTTPQSLIHAIQHTAPFSELSASDQAWLEEKMVSCEFDSGQAIASHGPESPLMLWLILAGDVELLSQDGQILEIQSVGEVFGHAIVFDDASASQQGYASRAKTSTHVAFCPAEVLNELIQRSAVVAGFVSTQPGDRLRSILSKNTGQLSDLGLSTPITGQPQQSIQSAAALMAQHRISSLPLIQDGQLVGIVTDRDLRTRVLATGMDPQQAVRGIMTPSPKTLPRDALTDDAMLLMMQSHIHHLPVVDDQGRLAGMVSAGDLLRIQAPHPLRLARDMARAASLSQLIALAHKGPGVLARLVQHGSEVTEVGRIASMLTDTITQRLLTLATETLGSAPMAWCWVAFGSQARMEQGLISDQDNGIILEHEPEAKASDYFKQLATYVCDGLNACGYEYCHGGVMAMGRWRMSLEAWRHTFFKWMNEPDPQSIMNCSIFFDQRCVAGDGALLEKLQHDVLHHAQQASIFLRFLATESLRHTPALGLFNRFLQESEGELDKGINLKKRGVLPIVDLARVRALEGAIGATHTETRLQQAAEKSVMNAGDADDLIHALRFIGNVRLRHQVARLEQGLTPNHLVDPEELSKLHQRYLRSAFGIVRRAHHALATRYQL